MMGKGILTKEEAEKVTVAFNPRKFPVSVSPVAAEFLKFQAGLENPSFRIDQNVALQIGVAEVERLSIEEKVEREALTRLKEMQEQAYQQAYQLGLEEGRELAFQQAKQDFVTKLGYLDRLLESIVDLKSELVSFNEAHIVSLTFYLARRIAMDEVSARPETVLNVVRHAIEMAQTEENVTVRVAAEDLLFINSISEKLGQELQVIKKAKLEESPNVSPGGCIVSTNYGEVDARIEQRIEKIWAALAEKLPKVKDEAGSGE